MTFQPRASQSVNTIHVRRAGAGPRRLTWAGSNETAEAFGRPLRSASGRPMVGFLVGPWSATWPLTCARSPGRSPVPAAHPHGGMRDARWRGDAAQGRGRNIGVSAAACCGQVDCTDRFCFSPGAVVVSAMSLVPCGHATAPPPGEPEAGVKRPVGFRAGRSAAIRHGWAGASWCSRTAPEAASPSDGQE
jgi:hypothetical protein